MRFIHPKKNTKFSKFLHIHFTGVKSSIVFLGWPRIIIVYHVYTSIYIFFIYYRRSSFFNFFDVLVRCSKYRDNPLHKMNTRFSKREKTMKLIYIMKKNWSVFEKMVNFIFLWPKTLRNVIFSQALETIPLRGPRVFTMKKSPAKSII